MWGLLRRFPMSQYLRPLWLFWSGPGSVPLDALCQMYLARFGIEHFFRFAKQRLGLLCAKSPTLQAGENWRWVVALAYTQLLLARTVSPPNRDLTRRSCPKSGKTKPQRRPRRAHARRNCKGSTNSTQVEFIWHSKLQFFPIEVNRATNSLHSLRSGCTCAAASNSASMMTSS